MTVTRQGVGLPRDFETALDSLRRAALRSEVTLEEIPAPTRLAPFAVALSADVSGSVLAGQEEEELATGRFILLYDPQEQPVWGGSFRIVTFLRAQLDPQMGNDQMLGSVAWTWLVDALRDHHAPHTMAGGTATRVLGENFGSMAGSEERIDIELRASWTPLHPNVTSHLEAWVDMVASFAGLPPLPEGVIPLPRVRLT
ncbi:DUF3000 domain-containing protein [Galactobacter caseinivorans]|uniref:DUF3000 domain-containing protein n=1 Tax=Galactobacter caseinivorans TaxID=2676123 RepID=UPI001F405DCE|nr:DUF3000 domain-containing protein [Galactobacter caseinivorans]